MTYKEFKAWCNERACDGCWGLDTAVYCIEIMRCINSLPFWKRKKAWQEVSEAIEKEIVCVIDKKRAELGGKA